MNTVFYKSCILLIISISFSLAQVSTTGLSNAEEMKSTVYGIGLSAGWSSGVGVSLRSHLPSNSSLQVVFGIIKKTDKLYGDIAGEYQYDLVRHNTTRFFTAAALAYYYKGKDSNEVEGPFRTSFGIGGEFQIQDALHVSVEGMFVFFSDGRIIPLPQISAHYYFF